MRWKKLFVYCCLFFIILFNVHAIAQTNQIHHSTPPAYLIGGCGAHEVYAVFGHSEDGAHWTSRPFPQYSCVQHVVWGNNQYLAFMSVDLQHNTHIIASYDGSHWNDLVTLPYIFKSVTWGNNQFVAVAYDDSTDETIFLISLDGKKWQREKVPSNVPLVNIKWMNGEYIAVGGFGGDGHLLTSTDGKKWVSYKTENFGKLDESLSIPTILGPQYIVVANYGFPLSIVSIDKIKWNFSYFDKSIFGLMINSLAVGASDNIIVGVGISYGDYSERIYTSWDGTDWKPQGSSLRGDDKLNKVIWADKFIAVGDHARILTSPDGINWTKQSSGLNDFDINDIASRLPIGH